ncbi:MAG: ABC transporter permease subunit, partial [Planctomycetales bacterium]|nr:ABC transporter permease subunit [Planctomycetales bacterium]
DGSIRVARLGFESELIAAASLPTGLNLTRENSVQTDGESIFVWFDSSSARRIWMPAVEWSDAYQLADSAILALDYVPDDSSNRFARTSTSHALAVTERQLFFAKIEGKKNMMGKTTETVIVRTCELPERRYDGSPLTVATLNNNQQALIAWPSGTLDRFSLTGESPEYAESQSAVVGSSLTCVMPLLARQTLVCGTEDGRLLGWSVVRGDSEDDLPNGAASHQLALTHEIAIGDQPLIALASSQRSHVAVACDQANRLTSVYVTTNTVLGQNQVPDVPAGQRITQVCLNPEGNILVAAGPGQVRFAQFDMGYPEASLRGYFGKVWYEGHAEPKYIWQSSSASEQSEIKLSLMPLVFGTLKATAYAMFISIPLAILAAIYTSEFLTASLRTKIKPIVELMASLPSVVLGYIAAMVVAPYLQEHLMALLTCIVVVPTTFVVAGNLWNLLPVSLLVRLQSRRLALLFLCVPIALAVAYALASPIEEVFFSGSIVGWLGSDEGSPVGGWMLLLLPLLCLLAAFFNAVPLASWNRRVAISRTPKSYAIFSLARLAVSGLLIAVLTWLLAAGLSGLGLDLRSSVFTNYQDKNAMLVGVALGFCVIPLIYTLSDDALQAVPQSLRSASLGCGATPWQTTVRVVVPSAISGLFSAIMIGLGRAVGETMVVLCAAGNTPLMDVNPFNGFKTLSAALATELPEAAKGSTHFRTLFLAALLLFMLTLVANTLAEFVRIRFRKRASQL